MIYVTTYYGYEYDRLLRTIKAAPVSTHMHGYGSLDTYVLWKDSAVQFVIFLRSYNNYLMSHNESIEVLKVSHLLKSLCNHIPWQLQT